ncbi:MAG TPA: hypothetical protein VN818_00730 [Gammaproteobacteria bacterium]|nr:hypothetical protein [Gammaproteobacteria bacterium]
MQTREIALGIAAAAVIVAGGLVLLARERSDPLLPVVQPAESEAAVPTDAPLTLAVAPAPSADAVIAAKVRELEAMSETYRNTTFVIAIRDAGYTCNELLRVYGGFEESGKWTATCSQMLAYTVGVAGNGALRVEPMNVYWDGVTRPVIQQFNEPVQPLRDSIPVVPPPER